MEGLQFMASGSNLNCALKAGFMKGRSRGAVLIKVLHADEGCWPGEVGLIRPII